KKKQASEAGKVATEFIEALMVEDYEAAMERMMFGKDGTFVDADGVAWYLPRTDLRDIVGMDGKVIDIVEGEGTSSKKNRSNRCYRRWGGTNGGTSLFLK